MKALIIISFILIFTFNIQAQVIISGQIKDSKSKQEIEFCNILIFNKKDSFITNTVTNEKGFFSTEIQKGTYKLVFSRIGYKNDTTKSQQVNKSKFLGIFKLKKTENKIDEIIVSANSTENKLDRDIILITKKIKIGTSDTKDILNKLNGVYYDFHSRAISVDGDNNIVLLVNGLEKDTEYIKNISPNRVKKVEIIRDPDGKYGLKGYATVVNIILKPNYQGLELHVSNDNESNPFKENVNEICVINSFYSSINFTKNKVNIYGLVNNNYKNLNNPNSLIKEYNSGLIQKYSMIKDDDYSFKHTTNNYTFGIDYFINPKHSLSFESNINSLPSSKNIRDEEYKVTKSINSTVLDEFIFESNTNSENRYYRNTIFYKYVINQKNILTADFSYTYYIDDFINSYNEINRYESTEIGKNTKRNTIFYMNFNHTFSSKISLITGVGNVITDINNSNTSKAYNLINKETRTINNNLIYSDKRQHLYSYFSWNPISKIGVKVGGVIETNTPKSEKIQSKRYFSFQPYFNLKYKPFNKLIFKLKYRSKTRYPSIAQLNPFVNFIDKQTILKGNANLKPRTIHKVSLRSDFFGGKVSFEPYYLFSNNYISKIATLRTDSILEYTYLNVGKFSKKGIKANFKIPFGNNLSLQSTFNFFQSTIEDIEINNSFFDWITNQQLMYENQKYNLLLSLTYQKYLHKYITAYGYVKANDDFWIVTAQKSFLKQKLNITLGYYLPLDLGVNYKQGYFTETPNYYSEKIVDIGDAIKNYIMLSISYNFNKGKSTRKIKKKIKEEKEIKDTK